MVVDAAWVHRVAALARLRVPPERVEGLARDLAAILGWVDQLGPGAEVVEAEAPALPLRADLPGTPPGAMLLPREHLQGEELRVPPVLPETP